MAVCLLGKSIMLMIDVGSKSLKCWFLTILECS